jgi:hypothetical protein
MRWFRCTWALLRDTRLHDVMGRAAHGPAPRWRAGNGTGQKALEKAIGLGFGTRSLRALIRPNFTPLAPAGQECQLNFSILFLCTGRALSEAVTVRLRSTLSLVVVNERDICFILKIAPQPPILGEQVFHASRWAKTIRSQRDSCSQMMAATKRRRAGSILSCSTRKAS